MSSSDVNYIPIEHAPVKRGNQDDRPDDDRERRADLWVGCVVISRWEAEEGFYLERYDQDWDGELTPDVWFPSIEAARESAAAQYGALLGSWRPDGRAKSTSESCVE